MSTILVENPIKPKRKGRTMPRKKTTTRRKPRRRAYTPRKRSYRRRRNPRFAGLALNEALMTFLGVLVTYEMPNILIEFFGFSKFEMTTDATGTEVVKTDADGNPVIKSKNQWLMYQAIAVLGVYFFSDALKIKASNRDALLNGMIAGLALQFVDGMLFKDKSKLYGYVSQNGQMSGYLSQKNLGNVVRMPMSRRQPTTMGNYPTSPIANTVPCLSQQIG